MGGGKPAENLILDSGVEVSNAEYLTHSYSLSEPFELNTEYTLTIWGELGEEKEAFRAFVGDGNGVVGSLNKISDGIYSGRLYRTIPWGRDDLNLKKFDIYAVYQKVTVTSTIHRIKLERGTNLTPIWTPSPYDYNSIYTRLAALESKISQ